MTTFVDTFALQLGTTYTYKVKSLNGNGLQSEAAVTGTISY